MAVLYFPPKRRLELGVPSMSSKRFFEELGVTAAGAASSLLAAVACEILKKLTGISLFTFSMWVVVPVGAIFTGGAAASGYYLGSIFFNHKPTKLLLLNMVLIAGATQVLIYYFQYVKFELPEGGRSTELTFLDFVNILLTHSRYSFGRYGTGTPVEVGSFGYALVAIQFVGFLVGGAAIWIFLTVKPFCEKCLTYRRKTFSRDGYFASVEEFKAFAVRLDETPRLSEEHLRLIVSPRTTMTRKDPATVMLSHQLFACPACKDEMFLESLKVFNGRDWKQAGTENSFVVPPGSSILASLKQAS